MTFWNIIPVNVSTYGRKEGRKEVKEKRRKDYLF